MEQGISENDQLARMIAELIGADTILFLTSVGGVYETDPGTMADARCYSEIDRATALQIARTASSTSANGRGGIVAKLREAVKCAESGMQTVITGTSFFKVGIGLDVGGTRIGTSNRFWPKPLWQDWLDGYD